MLRLDLDAPNFPEQFRTAVQADTLRTAQINVQGHWRIFGELTRPELQWLEQTTWARAERAFRIDGTCARCIGALLAAGAD